MNDSDWMYNQFWMVNGQSVKRQDLGVSDDDEDDRDEG